MPINSKVIMLLFILSIQVSGSQYEYWENRFQTILSCNSKSGAAISEVKITSIQNTSKNGVMKIIGNYRQAMPFVGSFGHFSTNNFAENTGIFQAFVNDTDETVISAKYKISVLKGFVVKKCLKSNADGFDF